MPRVTRRHGSACRRSQSEIEAVVRAWRESGATQRAFAERHGISRNTLAGWVRRAKRSSGSTALIPVEVIDPPGAAAIEVVLSNGRVVRVPSGFDAAHVARVLAVAEDRC